MPPNLTGNKMDFKEPLKVYTAESNVEAQMIVTMLESHGIAAFAEEDQSGVSLWSFGRISQFHQPNVWIEKAMAAAAVEHIRQFEQTKRERANPSSDGPQIEVECEECGKSAMYAEILRGSVQECPHCSEYVDIGELDWEDDFGTPQE